MDWINHKLYIDPIGTFIDPNFPVDKAIITHGHADHAISGHKNVLATSQTIDIMKRRYGKNCADSFQEIKYGKRLKIDNFYITFYPAGHILGSAQILIEHKNQRVLVSGDYSTIPDQSSQDFELVKCNLFITEATFGLPIFKHPDPKIEIKKLIQSIMMYPEKTHLVGAYALGKTQRLIKLLREEGYDETIYLHGSQIKICEYYEKQGIKLGKLENSLLSKKDNFLGSIVIAPPSALKDRWSRRFENKVICYASGWMNIKQRAKQSLVELPLIISDHVDWNELTQTILDVEAEKIWVTHGREEALVYWCKKNGLNAEPLYLQGRIEEINQ